MKRVAAWLIVLGLLLIFSGIAFYVVALDGLRLALQ